MKHDSVSYVLRGGSTRLMYSICPSGDSLISNHITCIPHDWILLIICNVYIIFQCFVRVIIFLLDLELLKFWVTHVELALVFLFVNKYFLREGINVQVLFFLFFIFVTLPTNILLAARVHVVIRIVRFVIFIQLSRLDQRRTIVLWTTGCVSY